MQFLTQGDAEKDDVVLSLWHDNLKLLVVTDGEKGCRYYTKVRALLVSRATACGHNIALEHLYTRIYLHNFFFPFLHILISVPACLT